MTDAFRPELGAFLGALMAGPLADKYSRKYMISAWCIVFMIGTALQTGANHNVGYIYCELRAVKPSSGVIIADISFK